MNYVLWESCCQCLSYALICELVFSDVVGSRETNVLTVISGIHRIILILSGVVSSKETNVIVVIPGMHMIIFALSSATSLRKTSVLAVVLGIYGTLL